MSCIVLEGGQPLSGALHVQGAKNSVLPILAASVMSGGVCRLCNCPRLRDVQTTEEILALLGCETRWEGEDLVVDASCVTGCAIPEHLMRRMRSSVIFLGAILTRCGRTEISYPGGCELGARPIDLHLSALRTLGASVREDGGSLHCSGKLRGGEIVLALPSVGATENAILAACGAEGTTVISNAAREPEIGDLQAFLQAMGASVHGAGTSTVVVEGGKPLHSCDYRVMGDRIVAATYLAAAAGAGGEICLRGADCRHLSTVTTALMQAGCRVRCGEDTVWLQTQGRLRAVPPVRTSPYPGFPTDAQAVLMAALLRAEGTTVFVENIFENRYRHVAELHRMGARIRTEGRVALVCGTEQLHAARVCATDLRGGAALVVAGLQARGTTRVENTPHIHRGYADLVGDLRQLGAHIREEP